MPRYSEKIIAEALRESRGMVYVAAERLGCSHNTILARLEKSAKLREVKEAAEGKLLDKSELKLEQAVLRGEAWAIKYVLSTKGKERGYVERVEQTGPGGGPVNIRVVYDDAGT